MNEIVLVTANFSGIDTVKPLPPHESIDAFCYTDEETRAKTPQHIVESWSRVLVPNYPRHDFGPRLRSRYFKHQIHRLDEVRNHRWLAWADASIQLHETKFILEQVEALGRLPAQKRILVVPHPARRTVGEEYEYIKGQIENGSEYLRVRYQAEKMTEQIAFFRQQGWSLDARLWCGGFWIVENSDPLRRCWDDWWNQIIRFGMMDQLSLPVLLDHHQFDPQTLAVNVYDNAHFMNMAHRTQDDSVRRRIERALFRVGRTCRELAVRVSFGSRGSRY
jgi:hypothetical protein